MKRNLTEVFEAIVSYTGEDYDYSRNLVTFSFEKATEFVNKEKEGFVNGLQERFPEESTLKVEIFRITSEEVRELVSQELLQESQVREELESEA